MEKVEQWETFSPEKWHHALEAAEESGFQSTEDNSPLANWLCEVHARKDTWDFSVLQAVINIWESSRRDHLSPEDFMRVLGQHRGSTVSDFQKLVDEHMEEIYGFTGNFPGNPSPEDYKDWYLRYACADHSVYTEVDSGDLHWFTRSGW